MLKELSKNSKEETVVGENVRVTGKLHTTSNIQINGIVKGEVSSDGRVIIGKTATISGPVTASEIKVEGTVKGNIVASNTLELESEAKVFGDIQTKVLSIKSGAIFTGKSTMGEEVKPASSKPKEEKKEKEPEPELEIE